MKKNNLFIITILILSSFHSFSQGYSQKNNTLNLQIIAGNGYHGSTGYTNKSETPGLMISYDIGVHELISIAPYLYYQSSKYEYNNGWNYGSGWNDYTTKVKYNNIGFGVRGLFHYGNMLGIDLDKLDLYGGLAMGFAHRARKEDRTYYNNAYADETYKSSAFNFDYDLFAGARWYFTNSFAVNVELGTGISLGKIGVTFKI